MCLPASQFGFQSLAQFQPRELRFKLRSQRKNQQRAIQEFHKLTVPLVCFQIGSSHTLVEE